MSKFAAIAAVAIAAAVALPGTAFAGGHHHDGDVIAAGAIGLLGGAILGGVLAQPQPAPVYVEPVPVYRAPRAVPVYVDDPAAAHEAWCAAKYRSYNVYDNTWIDKYGRLRACASPYLR